MKAPVWVLPETVLALHDQLLAAFGGPPGIRDSGLVAATKGVEKVWAQSGGRGAYAPSEVARKAISLTGATTDPNVES